MPTAEPTCDETTNLLQEPGSVSQSDPVNNESSHPHWINSVVLLCGGAVLLDLSNNLGAAAEVAIMEDIVCHAYYANSAQHVTMLGVDKCKIEPIQTEVAFLNGWRETFETIPAILLALPYGMLADWIGYRPVALLAFFGTVMCSNWSRVVFWLYPTLPTRALWFSALWEILGGGPQVATSLTFSAVASITPARKRTTVFSQMTAVVLTTELIGPPIGAMLMVKNPWIPFLTSSVIAAIPVIWGVLFFPAIQNQTKLPPLLCPEQQPVHSGRIFRMAQQLCGQLSRNRNVALVVACFFVTLLGAHTFGLLLQYVSKRFHVSYAEASYVLSLRASFNLISLFILLPVITNLLDRRYGWEMARRDKILTQFNALLMLLGCLLIFVAPSLICLGLGVVVFGLGSSFSVTARTLVTSLVDPTSLSTVYTLLSIMGSIGSLVSGPLLAGVYHMGMVLGDVWLGLPFLFAAALYGLSLVAISIVKVTARTARSE